jgi:hypothetical protein
MSAVSSKIGRLPAVLAGGLAGLMIAAISRLAVGHGFDFDCGRSHCCTRMCQQSLQIVMLSGTHSYFLVGLHDDIEG